MTNLKEELQKKYEALRHLPFPSFPEDLEAINDLALIDSNLAGSVSSYLSGSKPAPELEDLTEIKLNIEKYKCKNTEERQMIEDIKEYLKVMEELNYTISEINNSLCRLAIECFGKV